MGQLRLYLFGSPRLELDNLVVGMRSRKGLALLAYLSTIYRPVEREELAALFWPQYDDIHARANLRRTLFALKRTPVGEWLEAEMHCLALSPAAGHYIDLIHFKRNLVARDPTSLARAVTFYRGEFLAGFNVPGCVQFAEWAILQRERYKRRVLRALKQLAAHHLTVGGFNPAIRYARRQLELDNLREVAWRQLMAALAGDDRRAEALAEFRRCQQILMREVGVKPAGKTTSLATAIQTGNVDRFISSYW